MDTKQYNSVEEFAKLIDSVRQALANVLGVHLSIDGYQRGQYDKKIMARTKEILTVIEKTQPNNLNRLAESAHRARNEVMDFVRKKSTAVGKALAIFKKETEVSFELMLQRKTHALVGDGSKFSRLTSQQKKSLLITFKNFSQIQKNTVFKAIVTSAGKANPNVNIAMTGAKYVGFALSSITFAFSAYKIYMAEDKLRQSMYELELLIVSTFSSFAAGFGLGALCSPVIPLAPACAATGAMVGGYGAAMYMDMRYDEKSFF